MKLEFSLIRYSTSPQDVEYGLFDKNKKLIGLLTLEKPYNNDKVIMNKITMEE